jgi:thioredoxin 1
VFVCFACANSQKHEESSDIIDTEQSTEELVATVNQEFQAEAVDEVASIEEKIIMLNDENFEQTIKEGLFLVDFYADWCKPCKMMHPVLVEFAAKFEDKIKVCKINVDKATVTSGKYNIKLVPCLVVFKGGKEAKRFEGYQSAEDLQKGLAEYIK